MHITRNKMDIRVYDDKEEMGEMAAAYCAGIINKTVQQKKRARIILATGASQFKFLDSLVKMVIPWNKVTCFHLDEYVGLSETHPVKVAEFPKLALKHGILLNLPI